MEHADGGPPTISSVPNGRCPEAGEHDILVRTLAVSLNYRDKLVLETGMGLESRFPLGAGPRI